ncbi:NACHT nucleoside triphosphatase [Aspergillus affinis]|uniref:NACHT nucleoside triphosphatase n=1 Tax=Aspergillus affinis TaxID=1070780 RepID=UPI0022FDB130|nr:NACHT nucleoside triphosphatase [Aspergillus affinis]KAI9037068.1 NACHT nucleoside triphosphatase [Aspergillus affinis]
MQRRQPVDRNVFSIAIICALREESDAVEATFDHFFEDDELLYNKVAGDLNTYTFGQIGLHHVVLAYMPGMGKANSASLTASFRASFPLVRLGLVVGICGGVPYGADEIFLGDVIISTGVVQTDFGRQYTHQIIRKDTLEDNLARPNAEIRAFLHQLRGWRARRKFQQNVSKNISKICGKEGFGSWTSPGAENDKLYRADYGHIHRGSGVCSTCAPPGERDLVACDSARTTSCALLKCDETQLIQRKYRTDNLPAIHFGRIASSDQVIKSAPDRDRIAKQEEVLGFEMEGAGVWDNLPTIIVKGVCDYADSHKNKKWQKYASVTAASCAKALLQEWRVAGQSSTHPGPTRMAEHQPETDAANNPDERASAAYGDNIGVMDREKRGSHDNLTTFNNKGSVSNQGVHQTFYYYCHDPTQSDDSPTDLDVLDSLAFPGIDERRGNVKRPHTDTCTWILKLEEYRDWMDRSHGLLWVKGKPGSGKSTLMAFMHQEIKGRILPGNPVLEFFFSARGTELQRTPLGMFRSLLNQLCRQDADTRARLRTTYEAKCAEFGRAKNGWEWRQPELEIILQEQIVASAKHKPLTIFVDALDEAGAKSASELVEYFNRVNDSVAMNGASGKICISCRHYPVLISESGTEICVENHNHDDISTFIHNSLPLGSLLIEKILDHQSWDNLKMELIKSANGIFQWVRLIVPLIKMKFHDGESVANVQQFIRRVPHELGDIYEYILHSVIPHEYRTRAFALFQWVCLAERPLSVTELRYAMAAKDACTTLGHIPCHKSPDFISDDGFMKRRVNAMSGGLIEVVSNGSRQNVQVIHQSVNDFLLAEGLRMLANIQNQQGEPPARKTRETQNNDFTLESIQGVLYRACLHYLTTENIPTIQSETDSGHRALCPFLDYATINLFIHAKKARAYRFEDIEQEICWLEKILLKWITSYRSLHRGLVEAPALLTTLLHISCQSNLTSIVRALLSTNISPRTADERGNTALHYAARCGHSDIGRMLIGKGADLNVTNNNQSTALTAAVAHGQRLFIEFLLHEGANIDGNALQTAARKGSAEVVQMLLDAGVDVNAQGGKYGNALQAASDRGSKEVVQMLLDSGTDVNTQGGWYGSALQAASFRKSKEVVQMLLDAGADVNTQGGWYSSALQAASFRKSKGIVQILLDAGADVNAQGGRYGHALQAASYQGSKEVVQMLLDAGADVNAQGGKYGSALQAASDRGSKEVVQMLLDAGADVNTQGGWYGNALQAASFRKSKGIVRILLDAGADVNAQDGKYGSALQAASDRESKEVVQMLLDSGADVNTQGGVYGNALQAAVQENVIRVPYQQSNEVVQMLLDAGADVNAQGGEYGNALQAASFRKSKGIVQMLLDAGADVNAQGGKYGSALQAASDRGSKEVVQMLLDAGANVNAKSGLYGNALQTASYRELKEVVQILLDAGADVNAQGGQYSNALQAASCQESKEVVQMLLDAKADVNAKGGKYGSSVHAAIRNGYPETAKRLLLHFESDRQRVTHTAADRSSNHNFHMSVTSLACLQITDFFGRTPLHLAVTYGHLDLIPFLSEPTAPPLLSDNYGRNPLDWASNDPVFIQELKKFWPAVTITPKETQMQILQQSLQQSAKNLLQSTDNWLYFELFQLGRCLMFLEKFDEASFIFSQQPYHLNADNPQKAAAYCHRWSCARHVWPGILTVLNYGPVGVTASLKCYIRPTPSTLHLPVRVLMMYKNG